MSTESGAPFEAGKAVVESGRTEGAPGRLREVMPDGLTARPREEASSRWGQTESIPGRKTKTFRGDGIRVREGGGGLKQRPGLARCDAGLFLASLHRS